MEIFSFSLTMLLAIGSHCTGKNTENAYFVRRSKFLEVVNVPAFVDKTQMIRHVFHGLNYILITAPTKFGKTTNLDMLNTFLCIPLNSSDRDNRLQIFQRLKIYKESPEFVNRTFGSYPVLYVDFKINRSVENYKDAVKILAVKVHESYLEHEYLKRSIMLEDGSRDYCTHWCGDLSYEQMTESQVMNGLKNLARYLYIHYNNAKVFLLVDEYDDIINNAMLTASQRDLNFIYDLFIGQLLGLVKSNKHVHRAVITGISYRGAGGWLSGLNNIKVYKFLYNHQYVRFYGFVEEEVNSLFTKFGVSTKEAADARDWYNGYICRNGRHVYNTYSILNFLQKRKLKSYWTRSGRVEGLTEILRYNTRVLEDEVRQMLGGKCIEMEIVWDMNADDFFELAKLITNKTKFIIDELVFSFLYERGYLSFDGQDKTRLRIPNREIEEKFTIKLKEYYIEKYKLDRKLLITCANFFNMIIPIAKKTTKGNERFKYFVELNILYRALGALLYHYKETNGENISNKVDFEHVMFAMTNYATGFTQKSQLCHMYMLNNKTEESQLDLYLYKGSFATIIELRHHGNKNPNSVEALAQILEKQYCSVFKRRQYTPQKIKYFLLVGLAINNKQNISVSCLLNTIDITQAVTVP